MAVEVKPPIIKEVTITKEGPRKSRKWRDMFSGFMTLMLVAITAWNIFTAGYHVASHNNDEAVTSALLALLTGGFVVFMILDMAMDAKFGRMAMRAMKDTGELLDMFGTMLAELNPEKPTMDPKKRARLDRENARRRAARAAAKKNATNKPKTNKK